MSDWRWVVVPGFLLIQAATLHLATDKEYLPKPPDVAGFPDSISNWRRSGDDPVPPEVLAQLNASVVLSRTYSNQSSGMTANLFVAWFQSQRGGASQPHSPKVCLPAGGW